MSPAPTARARPSPSCARCWRRRAAASTSTPRRIWFASTSASASARRAAAGSSATRRWPPCWRNASAPTAAEPITVFEIETAAAFLLFSRQPADVTLLEVGLGGRLDATNVIEKPLACAITPISMDHLEFLGDTIEKIAAEKAAILKRGVPAAIAPQADAVLAVIEQEAQARARAAARRRRALERARRARPPGLSGRRRAARSAAAEARRPPSGRERRHRHRRVARRRARAAARRPSRPASPRPNGRRGCSGSRKASSRRSLRRRASCGSTAATTPMARRAVAAALGDHRGARAAPAGADRRHADDQGQRRVPAQFFRHRAPRHRGAGAAAGQKRSGRDAGGHGARASAFRPRAATRSKRRWPRSRGWSLRPRRAS